MTAQPSRDAVTSTSYDDANEMLNFTPASSSAKNITYDSNGSLSTVTNSCGITTYTWDVRNRLVGISGFNAQCAVLSASFKYDAIGRRIQKTINGTTTQYVYDGLDIIQEKQGGSVTANYIRTLNIDEPFTRIKGSVVRHYVKDALGSIIALTDDSGVVKTTYTYDPFGNVTVSGEASDNPFQYTGRENDGTGLYYYRARYYSPEMQRFISEDPIGILGGINQFVYVGNNPMNWIDPIGLIINIPDYVDWMDKHALKKSKRSCARYVRKGLEAGGADTTGHPENAKDYRDILINNDFVEIPTENYVPSAGDTVVFQPYLGGNPAGHIQTYDGSGWVSDFKQKGFSPAKGYKKSLYKIYRPSNDDEDSCGCE